MTLAGAKVGDVLVLTKPIGSGTILAADMRRAARGEDILACHRTMSHSQERIARHLKDAHAMTDVTGFGLAGHLAGMCDASGVGATVRLADVPLMNGALELAEAGIRSTLYPDNRNDPRITAPDTAHAALMFDPQTGGGLLAALPRNEAIKIAEWCADDRYPWPFTIIGEITEGRGVTFN